MMDLCDVTHDIPAPILPTSALIIIGKWLVVWYTIVARKSICNL